MRPRHYNTADGDPAQYFRIDTGRWRLLPASRVFYTGKLAIGRHQLHVRTANSGGKPMRWDWQIGRVRPLRRTGARAVDIYDIDGLLTNRAACQLRLLPVPGRNMITAGSRR